MQLKNTLFIASLLLLVSCQNNSDLILKLENRLDSLENVHQENVDSLTTVLADYQSQLAALKTQEQQLRDSIAMLIPDKKSNVKVHPGPKPEGIPDWNVKEPLKR